MPDLPSGTVTFLFTDIAGSTALWERDRRRWRLLSSATSHYSTRPLPSIVVSTSRPLVMVRAAFHTASAALAAAVAGQQAILAEPWPEEIGSLGAHGPSRGDRRTGRR